MQPMKNTKSSMAITRLKHQDTLQLSGNNKQKATFSFTKLIYFKPVNSP